MRPLRSSPAHQGEKPAELVCSNSFRSRDVGNAVGLLKEEMSSLDSLIMRAAYKARVPAGGALAVDRDAFSDFIAARLQSFSNIDRVSEIVVGLDLTDEQLQLRFESGQSLSCDRAVIATGPLTDDALASWIKENTQSDYLYFYDSIAPIVDRDSIDMNKAFRASRYDKDQGDGDYINCAMNEEQYNHFITEIENAEKIEVKDFDQAQFFEGCLPIEEMIRRGRETLRYGPLKPVGITNPHKPEERAHAVVQLRQDNLHATLFNMVGFQTRMKWGEQKRIFRMIPGLENAEFVRMGAMHRNTYICSPVVLQGLLQLKENPRVHFAGQITGCEGYVESAAIGLMVGLGLSYEARTQKPMPLPGNTTALGALLHHILHADPKDYQPMNVNFGLFEELEVRTKKVDKKLKVVQRAAFDLRRWIYDNDLVWCVSHV